MNNDHVQEIMKVISHSGQAKSFIFESLALARKGDFTGANAVLVKADEELVVSHQAQTNLLFYDAEHNDLVVTLLMVHAADHMNSAETIRDLANELIEIIKEIKK